MCLCHFKIEHSFQRHKQECVYINKCRVFILNENDNILKSKNYKHKDKVPFVFFCRYWISIRAQLILSIQLNLKIQCLYKKKLSWTLVTFLNVTKIIYTSSRLEITNTRSVLCSSHTFKFISYNFILKLKPIL